MLILTPHTLIGIFLVLTIALIVTLIVKPSITVDRGGKILAFCGLCVFPVLAGWLGFSTHLEESKKTKFCLSCHTMEPYGKSLYVDDKEFIPAGHFQNNRVPREAACFTCHSTYTMYGDINAKWHGLRHVYIYYLGTIPKEIKLYEPYNNRECLHCHNGSRSFEENDHHSKDLTTMASIKSNKLSCMTSNCHDVTHSVKDLGDQDYWKPAGGRS